MFEISIGWDTSGSCFFGRPITKDVSAESLHNIGEVKYKSNAPAFDALNLPPHSRYFLRLPISNIL